MAPLKETAAELEAWERLAPRFSLLGDEPHTTITFMALSAMTDPQRTMVRSGHKLASSIRTDALNRVADALESLESGDDVPDFLRAAAEHDDALKSRLAA